MPLKRKVKIDDAIEYLNGLLRLDHSAVMGLCEERVQCNSDLAAHPSCQVYALPNDAGYRVGLLGVLNGLFGTIDGGPHASYGPISARIVNGKLVGFERT